jgi:hypothetical protein
MKIFHGVHHTEVNRVSFEAEGAGYRIPAGVKLELQAEDVEALRLKGDLDAIILPNIAKSFRAGAVDP